MAFSQEINNKVKNTLGSISAAKTLTEEFNTGFLSIEENRITGSFDLLSVLFDLIAKEPLDHKIISWLSEKLSDPNNLWLQGIEESIKIIIETNITNLITCVADPLVPDKIIGCGEFFHNGIPFSNEGITVPISEIDFTNVLSHCPNDKTNPVDASYYFGCKKEDGTYLETKDLWKTYDFNAFLWYVKNKGVYGNRIERRKLIWDNRYKKQAFTKFEPKNENFFTYPEGNVRFPMDPKALEKYNSNEKNKYKKKQILECRFIEGDNGNTDSFQFRLPASNYYRSRFWNKKHESFGMNKTIFEFNHEYLMSIKLLDGKVYLSQIISSLLGTGNFAFNFSYSKDEDMINEQLELMAEKVLENMDNEIDDCFFSFSEDEYQKMLYNAEHKKNNFNTNKDKIEDMYKLIGSIDEVNDDATYDEGKTKITSVLTGVTANMKEQEKQQNISGGWGFDYNYKFELLKMLAFPLVKPLFSPKIMTLFYINYYIMGNPVKRAIEDDRYGYVEANYYGDSNSDNTKEVNKDPTQRKEKIIEKTVNGEIKEFKYIIYNGKYYVWKWIGKMGWPQAREGEDSEGAWRDTIMPFISSIGVSIMVKIFDIIIEQLYKWIIEELTPIIELFVLKLLMEQVNAYKTLIEDMITSCFGVGSNLSAFGTKGSGGMIDNVDYVDIDVEAEKSKQTPISKTNC